MGSDLCLRPLLELMWQLLLFLPGLQGKTWPSRPPRTEGKDLVTSANQVFSALLKARPWADGSWSGQAT